jgi:hypothetical protein
MEKKKVVMDVEGIDRSLTRMPMRFSKEQGIEDWS